MRHVEKTPDLPGRRLSQLLLKEYLGKELTGFGEHGARALSKRALSQSPGLSHIERNFSLLFRASIARAIHVAVASYGLIRNA